MRCLQRHRRRGCCVPRYLNRQPDHQQPCPEPAQQRRARQRSRNIPIPYGSRLNPVCNGSSPAPSCRSIANSGSEGRGEEETVSPPSSRGESCRAAEQFQIHQRHAAALAEPVLVAQERPDERAARTPAAGTSTTASRIAPLPTAAGSGRRAPETPVRRRQGPVAGGSWRWSPAPAARRRRMPRRRSANSPGTPHPPPSPNGLSPISTPPASCPVAAANPIIAP